MYNISHHWRCAHYPERYVKKCIGSGAVTSKLQLPLHIPSFSSVYDSAPLQSFYRLTISDFRAVVNNETNISMKNA